ncbi:macrophage mannose receptor 1-like [Syngnathus typhle]|uniref:macrophage mannose receptor 1-like n=1 Tax=Syngnathus typhle TaxID=161592 RepID=UPI002A6B16CB|nr:macrophage mannose receptor 1-like [Syngnathus typhle]
MWRELNRVLLQIAIFWTCASANKCLSGWLEHGTSCYKKEVETPNGWLGARHHCVWQGGDLLSITSSAEEDFVKGTMGKDTRFWLGLSNQKCDDVWCRFVAGSQELIWSDGETTTYTNWASDQFKSADVASCAYVNQGAYLLPGKWRSGSCASSLAYMCKRPQSCPEGRTCASNTGSAVMKTSDCDDGNFLYGDDCYLFDATIRTWEDGEKFCLARRGHLASIHSEEDARFIIDHITYWQTWVGEKKKGNNYEWTDGTASFDYGKTKYYSSGDCSLLEADKYLYRHSGCHQTRRAVCKTAKRGGPPQLPPLVGQPDWTQKCGWWLDDSESDFCYLMIRQPTKTWQKAQDDCQRLQGNLLSITNDHEQSFVSGYFKALMKASSLWLGANVPISGKGSTWADGASFTYVRSTSGTPDGNCLNFLTGNGNWEYESCNKERGYVCKKRGNVKPTPAPDSSKCAPGWVDHGTNCYKKEVVTPNGWLGAWHHCVRMGGNLLSITSSAEEDFVKDTMGKDTPFWLGLSNQKCDKFWCRFESGSQKLTWSDGENTTHTNWASNQLESADVASCAYVNQGGGGEPGKWRSGSCLSSLAYMCKRPLNCPKCSLKSGPAVVTTSDCHDNTFRYGDYCYRFEKTLKTFDDAEKFCLSRGGHLASVHSKKEAQFVYEHSRTSQSPFVGLKKTTGDDYEWSDGTSFNYDDWQDDTTGDCAFPNSVGKLSASPCNTQRPFVCKRAKHGGPQQLPPSIGQLRWTEKCGWWLDNPSDDFCYRFNFQPAKTWQEAQADCKGRQGNLLSIANSEEQGFVRGIAKLLAMNDDASLWLGADASIKRDGDKWTDGSSFSYLQPSAGVTEGGKCLFLLTGSGDWKRDKCGKKRGYVCKKRGKTHQLPPHDGYKEELVCQDNWNSLECPDERVIRIRSAFHGRRRGDVCPSGGGSRDECRVEGALRRFRELCDNYQICPIYPIYFTDTDSCPGVSKYLRVVYSCEKKVCLDSLGIADGRIPDSSFSASSSAINAEPHKARLGGSGCWRSSEMFGSWIQVNLGENFKVTGIKTERCTYQLQSSSVFAMQFSIDGRTWDDHPKQPSLGTYILTRPVFAQYIRLLPMFLGLRFDVLGCTSDDTPSNILCSSTATDLSLDGSMTVRCPLGCAQAGYKVYGTRLYKQDSNICAAAIHFGVIENEIGGDVTLLKRLPQKAYNSATCNGIVSKVYVEKLAPSRSYTFADMEPRCLGPDWEEFADFCYKRFNDTKTWYGARHSCWGLDANLVSIRSEAERDWLHDLVKLAPGDAWTGLNDLVNRGRFVWSDRRKVTFTNWAPGKPAGLMENCVATVSQSGKWKGMSCMELNGYVCKMPTARYPLDLESANGSCG